MRQKASPKKDPTPRVKGVPWRVVEVRPLPAHRLLVRFADGTEGEVDVTRLVFGRNPGVFKPLRDTDLFNRVFISLGAVTWPGDLDLAPDAMYDEIRANGRWIVPS
jgi:hypothetical protein